MKNHLNGLILGAYHPSEEFNRLIKIKTELINNGWENMKLVMDFSTKKGGKNRGLKSFRERSFSAIDQSDIILILFTKGGQSDGRGMEVEHIFQNNFLRWKTYMIFEEEPNGIRYGSELILSELDKYRGEISVSTFPVKNDSHLLELIESLLINYLLKLPQIVQDTTI